jgi:hypothetical protein
VHAHQTVNPWQLAPAARVNGGTTLVPRSSAPLGRLLPYRRAAGESPPPGSRNLHDAGWSADLGLRGLGDMLLGLGLARALADATEGDPELTYRGSRTALMQRCTMPVTVKQASGSHRIFHRNGGQRWVAVPEEPPAWLDAVDEELVEVHAPLGMRYYLATEQLLGIRLPAERDVLPRFTSGEELHVGHVVFVAATSRPDRKDYGVDGFAQIAQVIAERSPIPCRFTLLAGMDDAPPKTEGFTTATGLDVAACVDLFATAGLVIGNDTGLTHLAALTQGRTGKSPEVIGLHGRHAATKWTTGRDNHHAVTTPFAQMLAAADRCPVRDGLDDRNWGDASRLDRIGPHQVADFAADLLSWSAT